MARDLEELARLYLEILQNPQRLMGVPNEIIHESERVKVHSRFATFIHDHKQIDLRDYFAPIATDRLGHLDREGREAFVRRVTCQQFAAAVEENVAYSAAMLTLDGVVNRFQIIDHATIGKKLLEAAVIEVITDPFVKHLATKKYST